MESGKTLYSLLEQSAQEHPDRLAIIDSSGSSATYEELNWYARALSSRLNDAGVADGHRVGICLPKSIASVASLFATMKSGAGYVPVDYTAPTPRNMFVFTDCRVSAILGNHATTTALADALPAEIVRSKEPVTGLGDQIADLWLLALDWPVSEDSRGDAIEDLAYILYTSGSTGNPKGVIHTHASALSFIDWCSQEIQPRISDRFSSHAPFHFDLSIFDLYVPIKHGASIALIHEELGKQPKQLAPFIRDTGVTVWYSTPSILRLLIDFGDLESLSIPKLRVVVFAGEVFPLKYLQRLHQIWPHPVYYNFYGPTETNVCTYYRVPMPLPAEYPDTLPIGFACSGDRLRVTNEAGNDVEPGSEGELIATGGSVMQGYWNLADANEAAFYADVDGNRWYRTGDIVREQEGLGYIYIGRRDRMVKRRGYRVELGEIEVALYRHEEIAEAAVIARPDDESGVRIEAFVVWRGASKPSQIGLKTYSAKNLPAYMIPDQYFFLESLPKTSTDKIDYQRLKDLP